MTIRLDHTIVPSRNKLTSAQFFAEIFGLTVKPGGYFAQVQINDSLTFDFADEHGEDVDSDSDKTSIPPHHYAFHVSDTEFDAIFGRVKTKKLPYGSGPFNHTDGKLYTRRGGRGFYFEDPNGHLLEVMTVPETGS